MQTTTESANISDMQTVHGGESGRGEVKESPGAVPRLRLLYSFPGAEDFIERPLDELIAEDKLPFYVNGKFHHASRPLYPAREYIHVQWPDGDTKYWWWNDPTKADG